MKDLKKNIEVLLFELKQMGFNRATIEYELDYSENYITQLLAKGGNEKFYKRLQKFKNDKLQNTTKVVNETKKGKDIEVKGPLPEIIAQLSEKVMVANASLKVILLRLAELEAKHKGTALSSEYAKLEREVTDVLKYDFASGEKLFQ